MALENVTAEDIYKRRFNEDIEFRGKMWKVLCAEYFQRFVPPGATVMEVAAGYCEFINNIRAGSKIAVDINTDTRGRAAAGVRVVITPSTDLAAIATESVDVIFISN